MTTDGGGWTLVLNYLHREDTNPDLHIRLDSLPLAGASELGTDESGTAHWGHASNSMLSRVDPLELRFYAVSSAHERVIHFKSDDGTCVEYVATGDGHCRNLASDFTALAGHTANLPAEIDAGYDDENNYAMTNFTFYRSGAYHWGIRGRGSRWEVDDQGGGHTWHQVGFFGQDVDSDLFTGHGISPLSPAAPDAASQAVFHLAFPALLTTVVPPHPAPVPLAILVLPLGLFLPVAPPGEVRTVLDPVLLAPLAASVVADGLHFFLQLTLRTFELAVVFKTGLRLANL